MLHSVLDATDRCPCGSGDTYGNCCAPILTGHRKAPTAEALMRSRYSAFCIGDVPYLLSSWHPDTRPDGLVMDDSTNFLRLVIHDTAGGGPFDQTGYVHFTAYYRSIDGRSGSLEEKSIFVRVSGRWFYVGD
ncbi:YchJ family protein [Corynebacterium sp. CCM 9204]|uniref:YchJ family protein n=1 Tax=Corynebacterium sp. CCM 9204 TaxID=3057616 RepID=UPI0035246F13